MIVFYDFLNILQTSPYKVSKFQPFQKRQVSETLIEVDQQKNNFLKIQKYGLPQNMIYSADVKQSCWHCGLLHFISACFDIQSLFSCSAPP